MKKYLAVAVLASFSGGVQAQGFDTSNLTFGVEAGYAKSGSAALDNKGTCFTDTTEPGCTTNQKLDDVGSSSNFGLALGYMFNDNFRTELALNYRGGFDLDDGYYDEDVNTVHTADLKSTSLMLNGYYSYPIGRFAPYLGAGVGYARNKFDTHSVVFEEVAIVTGQGATTTGFAWQLMAGVDYEIASNWVIGAGVRYADLGSIETAGGAFAATLADGSSQEFEGSPLEGDLTITEINATLRYKY